MGELFGSPMSLPPPPCTMFSRWLWSNATDYPTALHDARPVAGMQHGLILRAPAEAAGRPAAPDKFPPPPLPPCCTGLFLLLSPRTVAAKARPRGGGERKK